MADAKQSGPGRESLGARFLPTEGAPPVDWAVTPGLTPYAEAMAAMDARAAAVADGAAPELAWLLEHPALYTAGTGAKAGDLLDAALPVHASGRGGQYTYHGPGQRVAYLVLDLKRRRPDLRAYVAALESWLILSLADLGVAAERREDRVGAWVARPGGGPGEEDKVAAIGVRVRRWVSLHGVSLNVAPDLAHYAGIVPCGVRGPGVTSLERLGHGAPMARVDAALRGRFEEVFGRTREAPSPVAVGADGPISLS